MVSKVLLEILLGFRITEPIKRKDRRRGCRTMMRDWVLRQNKLFRCHVSKLRKKQTKETQQQEKLKKERKKRAMHMLDRELCHSTSKPIGDEKDTLKSFMAFNITPHGLVFRMVIGS